MKHSRKASIPQHDDDDDDDDDDHDGNDDPDSEESRNDMGDDFDDFEEGAQAGADDDFGDFDEEFQEPEAEAEADTVKTPPVSTSQPNFIPAETFVSRTCSCLSSFPFVCADSLARPAPDRP